MNIRFDQTKNIAYIKITGPARSEEILKAFDIAVSSEEYKKGMGRLWDFIEADLSGIDSHTIRRMAQYSLSFPPGINDVKVAFAAAKTLELGLSRMFQASSEAKTPIRVFKTIKQAEEWMVK
ncbi:MAG: hypothetical protein PVI71_05020 [Desulfobacterales bacterium]